MRIRHLVGGNATLEGLDRWKRGSEERLGNDWPARARSSLVYLNLRYGMRNVGMDFDRSLFGMKLSDCRSMARCLEYSESLTLLNLSHNMLDDDKVRMLASGLVNNLSVVHLDLSHNRIADRGVRALAKLLHNRSVITVLRLQNNQVCG